MWQVPWSSDEVTTTIGGLPDLLTESTRYVSLPPLLKHKA